LPRAPNIRGDSRVSVSGWATLLICVAVVLGVFLRSRRAGLDPLSVGADSGYRAVVRLGIANEPPFGYLDTAHGRVTGEAPELGRAVLARLGVKGIEVVTTEFRSLIPGLRAGRFDVIAAGMYVTPERCAQVLFSRPTYRIGEALLVRRGNPKQLHAYADVARATDAIIGIVAGSIELAYAEAASIPASRISRLKEASSAVDALRAGQIDAYAGTALTVQGLLDKARAHDLERAEPFAQPIVGGIEAWGYGAFAFRKRDRALRDAWNLVLDEYLGSAEHLSLVRPFGFTERELPDVQRAETLCARRGDDV
jgi:polar amino acid transport system substrate-binding protein